MIPRHAIDSMTCSMCQNGLSVFPIHSYGERHMTTCGRCPTKEDFLPQREHLYEQLAQHIEFSCRFQINGCIVKLKPAELEAHENICPHKPCLCPILPIGYCKWEGEYDDLFNHCEAVHPLLAFDNFLLKIDIDNSNEENYVFRPGNETFIVQIKSDIKQHKFYSNVRYCGPASAAKQFSYRVRFSGGKSRYACKVQPVQAGEIGPIITETATTTKIMDIRENLNYPVCVTMSVDIFVKRKEKEVTEASTSVENPILRVLECPVCLEYMTPPIIQCCVGHSFCQPCRNSITSCPTCRGDINDARNYPLEEIAQIVKYPCKYNKFGCTFTTTSNNIKQHQASCKNGPYKCFIEDCTWENKYTQLVEHLKEAHKENILETSTVTYILDHSSDIDIYNYVVILNNNIFQIEFIKSENQFSWTVRAIDENHATNFLFILDFDAHPEERLHAQTEDHTSAIVFDSALVEKFVEDDILTYKLQIIERG